MQEQDIGNSNPLEYQKERQSKLYQYVNESTTPTTFNKYEQVTVYVIFKVSRE